MTKTNTLAVNYEVSTLGGHSFYCESYRHEAVECNTVFEGSPRMTVNDSEEALVTVTVLENCIDRNTLYGGVYEAPSTWRIVGACDLRKLPVTRIVEVKK